MKKYLSFLVFFGLLSMQSDINGQSNSLSIEEYKDNLKISPIQFGKSYFEFAYEFGMKGGQSSIQIAPMIMLKRNNFEEFRGIQGEIQYRNYLKKWNDTETKLGPFSNIDFFVGLYGLGLSFERDYTAEFYPNINQMPTVVREDHTRNIFATEAGIFVGMKFIVGKRITLDLLAGGGVRYSEIDDSIDNSIYFNEDTNYYYYDDDNEVFDLGYYGVKPKLNLQIGITL